MSHWKDSTPQVLHGALVERVIFTPLEGDDPLRPVKRGAILTSVKRLSHAILEPNASIPPTKLKGEQEIYFRLYRRM